MKPKETRQVDQRIQALKDEIDRKNNLPKSLDYSEVLESGYADDIEDLIRQFVEDLEELCSEDYRNYALVYLIEKATRRLLKRGV